MKMKCCLFVVFVLCTVAVVIPRQLGTGRIMFNSFNFEEYMSHTDYKMMDSIDGHRNYYVNVTSVENRLLLLPDDYCYSINVEFDEVTGEDHKKSDDGNNNSTDDHTESMLCVFKEYMVKITDSGANCWKEIKLYCCGFVTVSKFLSGIWLINYQDFVVTFVPYAVLFIVVIPLLLLLIRNISTNQKLSNELKKVKSKAADLENYNRVLQQKCQDTENSLLASTSQVQLFQMGLESREKQLQELESETSQTVKFLESEIRDGKNEISQLRNDLKRGAEETDCLSACNKALWYQLEEEQYINNRMYDDLRFKDEEIFDLRDLLWEHRSKYILEEVVVVAKDTVISPETDSIESNPLCSMEEMSTTPAKDMAELPANLRFSAQV